MADHGHAADPEVLADGDLKEEQRKAADQHGEEVGDEEGPWGNQLQYTNVTDQNYFGSNFLCSVVGWLVCKFSPFRDVHCSFIASYNQGEVNCKEGSHLHEIRLV